MAGIAQLAGKSGHSVSGCDENVYPPMSTVLESADITIEEGYCAEHVCEDYDQIIIGNALSRGNALVESVLNRKLPYQSGPEWLRQHILNQRKVIAVAGTHGKTTTSSIAAWLLQDNQEAPGYLIGGKPGNFEASASAGKSDWFVIEADEYDTAFFDKRSKFVHYCPDIAILNNLEFDHADIFNDLAQIKRQFHHLLRIVPASGNIICNADDENIASVLSMGCWSNIVNFSVTDEHCEWYAEALSRDCSEFQVYHNGICVATANWQCIGRHNMANALAALIAANLAGVAIGQSCHSLQAFQPTARRLQLLFNQAGVYLYEDFAHHPTAIASTLCAVADKHADEKIIAVIEPRSNTMRGRFHQDSLGSAFNAADETLIYQSDNLEWQPENLISKSNISSYSSVPLLMSSLESKLTENTVIVCMSNGSFDNIPQILKERLELTAV